MSRLIASQCWLFKKMKTIINFSQFCDAFSEDRKNTYSYEGKKALFEYLENYEEETDEEIELDIIALCCDYTEYENLAEIQNNYSDIKDLDDLKDHTQVIEIEGTDRLIIQNY